MEITAQELVAGSSELESLPEIVTRLNERLDDPSVSAVQISRLVGQDTALAARVLRLANSPFYGFPAEVDTLARAIAVIGTYELRDLVVAASVTHVFKGIPPDLMDMDAFWRHSLHNAVVARVVAGLRREPNIEVFFLAGLLHDVGALLIIRNLPELARAILTRARYERVPMHEAERAVLGFDHAEVGAALMRAWHLPECLAQALACHHDPRRAGDYTAAAAVVHLADTVTNAMKQGFEESPDSAADDMEAWVRAGLSPGLLPDVLNAARDQYEAAYRLVFGAEAPVRQP